MRAEERLLFDEPGPQGRRRIRVATALSLVVIAGLVALAVRQLALNDQLAAAKWELFLQWPVIRFLLVGIGATLWVTVVSAVIAFPFGALLALARLTRLAWLRVPAAAFVELFRAVPLLLLLYVFLFALPTAGLRFPTFWQLVLPIVLSNATPAAEIFRAGVLALDRGQSEAAYSMGMSYWQSMRLVVIPQAVRQVAPALVSQFVRLLKDSTLGYVVSYAELLHQAQTLGEYEHLVLQVYLVAAGCYVLINTSLSRFAVRLERRQGRAQRGRGAQTEREEE
jgi:glutamate transport system permease protein